MSTPVSDRASVWRTLALIYDPAAKLVTLVDKGIATSVTIGVLATNYINEVAIVGSAAASGVGGSNPFDGIIGDWACIKSVLTPAQVLAYRPWQYRGFTDVVGCFGNSIMQRTVGGDFLGPIQDLLPANIALETGYAVGGTVTSSVLTALNTYGVPMLIPQSSAVFFWEFTNSIHGGSTLAAMQAYGMQVIAWCRSHGQALITGTVLPRSDNSGAANTIAGQFNTWLLGLATSDICVMDIGGIPAMQNTAGSNYADGTHPSSAGCLVTAAYIAPLIAAFLSSLIQ